ncbi:flagellar biosynthetic protein FliR [Noviherbaspirillum galbum]|uniref:Flagellar biosynthetic protein FliR n=1 Tax=Noviherbaspirillum galbum TaxID=2709383 RepID=A0A6B3SQG5_9BURK|nr:flagellar biosynthetic protein FliR [Noviherbaspirillum galbum]NEX63014.1 flagellar biosynthetic protein FliR [Noviherbaspirillum galbum]
MDALIFHIDPVWAMTVFLLWLRLGAFMLVNPLFSGIATLATIRVLCALAIAAVLCMQGARLPASLALPSPAMLPVVAAAAGEVLTGALLAFGVSSAFGVFAIAGKLIDVQSGLGLGTVFDPVTRAGTPLFATLLHLVAVAVFFCLDGHLALMRGLALSVQQVPPGTLLLDLPGDALARQFGVMFSLGVGLAAPVMFSLFMAEAALALASRALPQMNIFAVGAPVKIAVALGVLAATVVTLAPLMGRAYESIFRFWEQVA